MSGGPSPEDKAMPRGRSLPLSSHTVQTYGARERRTANGTSAMFLVLGGVSWALAATCGAIHRQIGGPCQGQGARLDTVRIALWGLSHRTQGVLQNGQ